MREGPAGMGPPRGGTGNAPPIFFLRHQKENAPCTVEKKKCRGPNPSLRSGLGKTGVERVGASVNDSLLPGAPGSLGTERVLPRSWRRGCGFRGWSSYGPCFSFRAPHCLRLSAAALRRLAPARACGRSRLALPGWQREGRFEVGRAAAAGRRRSNRSCILRLTQAIRRGRMTERFSKSESAPNASTESFSRSLLLGPPYHKQIRRKAPFCAQAPFLLTVNGRFLFGATEKKMGVHSPVRGPL